MKPDIAPIKAETARLKQEIGELESHFDDWKGEHLPDGKKLRAIAERIKLSAKRVEVFVRENTYSPR
jgi:hypothetical protein